MKLSQTYHISQSRQSLPAAIALSQRNLVTKCTPLVWFNQNLPHQTHNRARQIHSQHSTALTNVSRGHTLSLRACSQYCVLPAGCRHSHGWLDCAGYVTDVRQTLFSCLFVCHAHRQSHGWLDRAGSVTDVRQTLFSCLFVHHAHRQSSIDIRRTHTHISSSITGQPHRQFSCDDRQFKMPRPGQPYRQISSDHGQFKMPRPDQPYRQISSDHGQFKMPYPDHPYRQISSDHGQFKMPRPDQPYRQISSDHGQFKMPRPGQPYRQISSDHGPSGGEQFKMPQPEFDWDYLTDPINTDAIRQNIVQRKGVGDINKLLTVWQQKENLSQECEKEDWWRHLEQLAADIPNHTHPLVPVGDESQARLMHHEGKKREFDFKPKTVLDLGKKLGVLRTDNVGESTGPRTYYFLGALAQLEHALIQYTLDLLTERGFTLISVPDLVPAQVIEACGFKTRGERTQVYHVQPDHGQYCLAGTGEMALAGFFMDRLLCISDLPQRVCTVSRCFRAETSDIEQERGIYRVHQFTKVEMFGVTAAETGQESQGLMDEMADVQQQLFSGLGLHFRMLDMPMEELGAPAHRKYDIETWMPAKQFWGEISSTSNCVDFQSRRLNMKYHKKAGGITRHCHTVNGTACAVPRMIMALMENNQTKNGTVDIPEVLHSYMDGLTQLIRPSDPSHMKWIPLSKQAKVLHYE